MTSGAAPALALHKITKHFGAVAALQNATIALRKGAVHALLGENGAGKTTLMRIAFGALRPDAGSVERNGTRVEFRRPGDAIAAGVGMVHQHFSLIPDMTVAENIALGKRGRFSPAIAGEAAARVAAEFGLHLDPLAHAGALSVAGQQRVEIAKALSRNAEVLILDEPTAVLAPSDAVELLATLRRLADRGTAIVLITHKLRDALAVADDITVLRAGEVVLQAAAQETTREMLTEAMLGERSISVMAPERTLPVGAAVLRMRSVSVVDSAGAPRLTDASVVIQAGEIVGVAGVEGSGQQELLRVLAGRLTPTAGDVVRPPVVGFVPEDRHRDAVILNFSLIDNLALAHAIDLPWRVDWRSMETQTNAALDMFDIVAAGADVPLQSLSGGNQQRFVVARELQRGAAALVLENPTRGLDAHATLRVHTSLRAAASSGSAVVIYSSDLEELMAVAQRVLVCYDHRVLEVPFDAAAIGRAMIGRHAVHS